MEKHAPYRMIYDGDSFIDGEDCESLEDAIGRAQDVLVMWMQEECYEKKWQWDEENCRYHPTEEQIEDWDYMIYNMGCYVVEYTGDEEYDGYTSIDDAVWPRSQDDLDEIGWMLWEDRVKKIEEQRSGSND